MLQAACVLRSGGDFDPRWVNALNRNLRAFVPEVELTCLHDGYPSEEFAADINLERMSHDWPKWWGKVELLGRSGQIFHPGERVVFFDLDTVIVDNVHALWGWTDPGLAMLYDFFTGHKGRLASGVMTFRAGWMPLRNIYEKFAMSPSFKYDGGDGRFIASNTTAPIAALQNRFPGWFSSYKGTNSRRPFRCEQGVPYDVRVVCFHGKPRPHDAPSGWVKDYWSLE